MPANNAPLIYDIRYLGLPEKYEKLAQSLLDRCDMPMVFWMEANTLRNERRKHNEQTNQFWVTVRECTSTEEQIRLVIGGIYNNIRFRRRDWAVTYAPTYLEALLKLGVKERLHHYREFIGCLQSLVSTLDTECFLEQHEIHTEEIVQRQVFQTWLAPLQQHLAGRRHAGKNYHPWCREQLLRNLLEYGNYLRRDQYYQAALDRPLKQLGEKKSTTARTIGKRITTYKQQYPGKSLLEYNHQLILDLAKILHAEDMVCCTIPDVYLGEYPVSPDSSAPVFSFIPDSHPLRDGLIRWVRLSREAINAIQQIDLDTVPAVLVSLIESNVCAAFADGNNEKGYSISFTVGMVDRLTKTALTWQVPNEIQQMPPQEARNQLLRQIIYWITAHEYGHILNGDCEQQGRRLSESEKSEKEKHADRRANELLAAGRDLFYRLPPKAENNMQRAHQAVELMGKCTRDEAFLGYAREIIQGIRSMI